MRSTSFVPRLGFSHLGVWLAVAIGFFSAGPADAVELGWDGDIDNGWASFDFDINTSTLTTNWFRAGGGADSVPTNADEILLRATSTPGPVTIDLGGATRPIRRIESIDIDGAYTFVNGALEFTNASGSRILFSENQGDELIVDADVLLGIAGTQIINVNTIGQKVTVNGDVSSSAASGVSTLMATSRNATRPVSVELNGVISDGANAQLGLTAGFDGDLVKSDTYRSATASVAS